MGKMEGWEEKKIQQNYSRRTKNYYHYLKGKKNSDSTTRKNIYQSELHPNHQSNNNYSNVFLLHFSHVNNGSLVN